MTDTNAIIKELRDTATNPLVAASITHLHKSTITCMDSIPGLLMKASNELERLKYEIEYQHE